MTATRWAHDRRSPGDGLTMTDLPAHVALSSILTARVDVAARPALLAAVSRIPAPRAAADDAPAPSRD